MISANNTIRGCKAPIIAGIVLHVEAAIAVPVQGVLALIGGVFLAYQICRNLQVNPNPSVISAGVLDGNDLGNSVDIARAGDEDFTIFKILKTLCALLLLDQVNSNIADGEGVGFSILVGEVGQGAYGGNGDQADGQCQRNNFFLHGDTSFLVLFIM